MKNIIKNITPPIIWNYLQSLFLNKKCHPKWNTFTYKPMNGIRMFFDPSGKNWQSKMMDGSYDFYIFKSLAQMKLQGKVIYDVGAHIGFHSLYFARLVGNKGKVIAFEPNKENIKRLRMHLEANKDLQNIISAYEVAVSDKIGTEKFMINMQIESGRSMGNFLSGSDTYWSKEIFVNKGFKEVKVKTINIDSVEHKLENNALPDVIKIDVEGAEYKVLLGAENIIQKKRPVFFIEVHSIPSMFEVITFLYSHNYTAKIIRREPRVSFIEAHYAEK